MTNQILHNIKAYITTESQFLDSVECNDIVNKINVLINDEMSCLRNIDNLDLYET